MQINDAGLALLKSCEGCKLKAYPDPASGGAPWTVGYGHTGDDVYEGLEITQERADELLKEDIEKLESELLDCIATPVSSNQFSALVVFTYNVGIGNFENSSLLKNLNSGDIQGAADQFPRWNRAGGEIRQYLVERREKERALFLKQE